VHSDTYLGRCWKCWSYPCLDFYPISGSWIETFILKACLSKALIELNSIQLKSFPDNLGLVISTMEVFAGLGGILGPFVGGTLFDLGGYVAPFYGCGGFQLFTLLGME